MIVQFKNDVGINREVKVGFSWTSFFFGGFPFLFRGMPVHGIGWIFLAIITFGISNLILCFIINKQTAVHYLENGYKPVGSNWDVAASTWEISLPQQSLTPTTKTVTTVTASPLPLIICAAFTLISAVYYQFMNFLVMEGGWTITEFGVFRSIFSLISLGLFIWVALEYLDKTEHKVLAISLFVIGNFVPLVHGALISIFG